MSNPLPTPAEIRAARFERRLTQKALAELAGIHPMTLALLESGKRPVTEATLSKIVEALNKVPKVGPFKVPKLL